VKVAAHGNPLNRRLSVASYGHRLLDGLKRLFRLKNSRKAKEELPKAHFGESLITSSFMDLRNLQLMQKYQEEFFETHSTTTTFVPNDKDEACEVFLDSDGNIRQPFEKHISYDFCKIDRWYMPDCVPGIISRINVTHVDRHPGDLESQGKLKKVITVLHAEGKYIHLSPGHVKFLIEPGDQHYHIVEDHFARRGVAYIRDGQDMNLATGTTYGQRNKTIGITGTQTGRRQPSNPPVVAWGPDFSEYKVSYTYGGPANKHPWTNSGP
jgi:hypothetical protein